MGSVLVDACLDRKGAALAQVCSGGWRQADAGAACLRWTTTSTSSPATTRTRSATGRRRTTSTDRPCSPAKHGLRRRAGGPPARSTPPAARQHPASASAPCRRCAWSPPRCRRCRHQVTHLDAFARFFARALRRSPRRASGVRRASVHKRVDGVPFMFIFARRCCRVAPLSKAGSRYIG